MPVKSLNSSVLKWPDKRTIDQAIRNWIDKEKEQHPELISLGYFGSYARGNWGVGSDLDIVGIIDESNIPFEKRALSWDLSELPVPAEIILYTKKEWAQFKSEGRRFIKTLLNETVWIFGQNNL